MYYGNPDELDAHAYETQAEEININNLRKAHNFLDLRDITSAMIKAACFGILIAIIGCSWGLTTTGGAKGVGQSTTTAVVTALLVIFISNFFLSWLMFQGAGNPSIRP